MYKFKLYVIGETNSSKILFNKLHTFFKKHLKANFSLDKIDVFSDPQKAEKNHILTFPTLIKESPAPSRKITGCLNNPEKVLKALKSDDFNVNKEKNKQINIEDCFFTISRQTTDGILIVDRKSSILFANLAAKVIFNRSKNELVGNIFGFPAVENRLAKINVLNKKGENLFIEMRVKSTLWNKQNAYIIFLKNITEKKILENQLLHSRKFVDIGKLAAGIIHEINTPVQFISHNINFFRESFKDINEIFQKYEILKTNAGLFRELSPINSEIELLLKKHDLPYLKKEIPATIEECLEGIETISTIVKSLKEFSHPGSKEKENININKVIKNTITISKNEWKYTADLETDLMPDIPFIYAFPVALSQVILNIIINAVHAIKEKIKTEKISKGLIIIKTKKIENNIQICIKDSGQGIPKDVRSKIFTPFFTTKEIGHGTGQGLSVAYSVIVKQHKGTIFFETEEGLGTTFTINLPMEDVERKNTKNHL